jgi:flagellar hook-associated protein 2
VGSTLTGGTAPDFSGLPTRDAQDATVLFGGAGGVQISSSSNVFEDIVEGLDLTVHRAQVVDTEAAITVEVERDTASIESAIGEFVDRYNSAISFVNGQFRFDPAVGVRPPLQGSATLSNIASDLRSRITRPIGGREGAPFTTLFSIGIKSTDTGTLSFNATEFREALDENFSAVADLFRASATFDVPGVKLLTPPTNFDLATSELAIVISSNATSASVSGDEIDMTAGITIDSSNDTFLINIEGTQSEVLTLANDTYTDGSDLAQAIQSAIDASEDLGSLGVSVTFEGTTGNKGTLVLTANRAGSASTIRLDDAGSGFAADLGLTSVIGVTAEGTDVAGTVNGVAAEGQGSVLTVPDDVEDIGGMSFLVTLADSEVPTNVTATFAEGMARVVSSRLDSLTRSGDGTLSRLGRSIQSRIDSIARDVELKLEQLEKRRVLLQRQYASLESILGQLQNQGNFLNAQLQALSSSGFGVRSNS